MSEAIKVEGRKENFCPAECLVGIDMQYSLDTSKLKGSFYRGKADQAKVKMVIYPTVEACEQGGLNTNEMVINRDNVSTNPELAQHVAAIFTILKNEIATELGGEVVELNFPEVPTDT